MGNKMIKQPFIIMLVGMPCSGKSKFVEDFLTPWLMKQEIYADVLSTDDIVQHVATVTKSSFTSIHNHLTADSTAIIDARISLSSYMHMNIVLDQFNLTRKQRKYKLALMNYQADYFKIAIVFNEDHATITKRNEARTGRTLKTSLMKDLSNRYCPVIPDEGFDLIVKPSEFIDAFMKDEVI